MRTDTIERSVALFARELHQDHSASGSIPATGPTVVLFTAAPG
jgi:hypothetical protein